MSCRIQLINLYRVALKTLGIVSSVKWHLHHPVSVYFKRFQLFNSLLNNYINFKFD